MEDMCTKNTKGIDVTLVHSDYSKKMREVCIFIYKGRAYLAENTNGSLCHHCLFRGNGCGELVVEMSEKDSSIVSGICSFLAKDAIYKCYYTNVNLNKLPGTKLIDNYIPFEVTRDLTSLFIISFIQRKIKSKV